MKGARESIYVTALLLFVMAMGLRFEVDNGCSFADRMLYPFCHVNVFHLLANCWCLYVIRHSNFRNPLYFWVLAYLVAVAVPYCTVGTVGLSGVLYAVMGMMSWQAVERWKFHAWSLGFMALGLLFPERVNNFLHLWCYAVGTIVGLSINDCDRWETR